MSLKGTSGSYTEPPKEPKKKTWYFNGIPLTKETLFNALYIIALIVAICILIGSVTVESDSYLVSCALGFLVLSGFLYHYAKTEDIAERDREIANLKHEIYKLKCTIKDNEFIIDLLKKELDKSENE